jgi:hypothetical protein
MTNVVADETPPEPVTTWMIDPQATGAGTARPAVARRRYYVYVVELDDAVGPRRDPRYPSVGTVALSRNAPGKPSKVEALLHGRTPRRGRTTRPCHDLSSLSGEVEAVGTG